VGLRAYFRVPASSAHTVRAADRFGHLVEYAINHLRVLRRQEFARAPGGKFGRKKEDDIAAPLNQRNIEEAGPAVSGRIQRQVQTYGVGFTGMAASEPRVATSPAEAGH
jgi:hypothetical protein